MQEIRQQDAPLDFLSAALNQRALETEVLSAAILNKPSLARVIEALTEEDFEDHDHKYVFRVMSDAFVAGEPMDPVILRGKIDMALWVTLTSPDSVGSWSMVSQYIALLQEATQQRKIRLLGLRLSSNQVDSSQLLEILDEGLSGLIRKEGYRSVDMQKALLGIREERRSGAIAVKAIDYPWSRVNHFTRGLRCGWLCYLAGRPGDGKTAAAIELAFSAAKCGKKVLFNSLEMDSNELAVRIAQRFGLDSEAFYMGTMSDGDWKALDQAAAHPAFRNIRLETVHTVAKLTALVRSYRPDLVIVDYVQLMDIGKDTRVEGTTQISHALKRLARRYQVPVVALSQLSRALREQRGAQPGLADLKDSSSLEQDADQVIFVWRQMDREHNIPTATGCFIVAKARMGEPGKQKFQFDGSKQIFLTVDTQGALG